MLSKCANPECSEILRYLHQGKIFCLAPTPEVESLAGGMYSVLQERFWLCDRCSKEMTLIWGGTRVELVPLGIREGAHPAAPSGEKYEWRRRRPQALATFAAREDR
jgi:hypothetical protein